MVLFALANAGLPGTSGFVGEFLVLLGTATSATTGDGFRPGPLGFGYAIPAAVGIILSAVYMLWMCQRLLFGPLKEPANTPDTSAGLSVDLTRREISILAPIALCCVFLGVYPKPLMLTINASVEANILTGAAIWSEAPSEAAQTFTVSAAMHQSQAMPDGLAMSGPGESDDSFRPDGFGATDDVPLILEPAGVSASGGSTTP